MEFSRRRFLGSSAAAVIVAGTMAKGKVFGANDRIGVVCVGINGRGGAHIKESLGRDDVELVALCDVDETVLNSKATVVEKESKKKPALYKDIREAIKNEHVDAVMIATPNHWHSLAAIWACEAGKDVYVEKPLSHNIREGRQLAAAAKKYDRVVQHGTQSRSDATLLRDIKLMHDGFIGDIVHSRGYVYKNGNRVPIGFGKPAAPPATLDWPLWQGPSPDHDYLAKDGGGGLLVHYNWHWVWEYGNGEIGNQGVHQMDIAVWGHNRGLPVKVYSTGGRYAWEDQGETPNTQVTTFTYEDGSILSFEVRNLGSFPEANEDDCSNSFFGTKGYYVQNKGFFDYQKKPIPVEAAVPESKGAFGNFFNAVRTRKPEDNPCDAEVGHISCVHCHLGNTAYRLKRALSFDPKAEQFTNDEEANKFLTREYRSGFEVPQLA